MTTLIVSTQAQEMIASFRHEEIKLKCCIVVVFSSLACCSYVTEFRKPKQYMEKYTVGFSDDSFENELTPRIKFWRERNGLVNVIDLKKGIKT